MPLGEKIKVVFIVGKTENIGIEISQRTTKLGTIKELIKVRKRR